MATNHGRKGLVALTTAFALSFARIRRSQGRSAGDPQVRQALRHHFREGAQVNWWRELGLESPEALIKVFVSESKCFTLVDRGKGLQAAQAERELASSGDLRGGSNVGKGQMKAADYVLVPDVVNKNDKSGGKNIGGMLGGALRGHRRRGGGRRQPEEQDRRRGADASPTCVPPSRWPCSRATRRRRTSAGGGGGGGWMGAFAAAGASSYSNTEIGQVVMAAYLDAYVKLVEDVKELEPDAKANNVQQAVSHGQGRQAAVQAEQHLRGAARPGSGRHAVSHRREAGPVLEGAWTIWATKAGCRWGCCRLAK